MWPKRPPAVGPGRTQEAARARGLNWVYTCGTMKRKLVPFFVSGLVSVGGVPSSPAGVL
jgi:hypothetical protein